MPIKRPANTSMKGCDFDYIFDAVLPTLALVFLTSLLWFGGIICKFSGETESFLDKKVLVRIDLCLVHLILES